MDRLSEDPCLSRSAEGVACAGRLRYNLSDRYVGAVVRCSECNTPHTRIAGRWVLGAGDVGKLDAFGPQGH